MINILYLLFLFNLVFSNASGPPVGYANNYPSFQNCTVCHSGNVNSGNGSIEFSGLPIYYTPGQVYQIEVVVEGTNSRGYGFQATSQAGNIAVGSFALNNNSNYAEINGNYIQQDSRNPSGSWVFDWVAPSTDVGEITFSGSGLATGGSSSTSGDNAYTQGVSIPSQSLFVDSDLNIKHFSLHNNYPNPFNPLTTIQYEIKNKSYVELYIHDVFGNKIINLVKEVQSSGMRSIQWDANNFLGKPVASGTYFYTMKSNGLSQTKSMILLK